MREGLRGVGRTKHLIAVVAPIEVGNHGLETPVAIRVIDAP